MRATVNLYRDKDRAAADAAMMDESDVEEEDDGESFPEINVDDLLEEMDGLAIDEDEEAEDEEEE